MRQILKNLRQVFKLSFFCKALSKKQTLLLLAPFIFLGLLYPFYPANAAVQIAALGLAAFGAVVGILASWVGAAAVTAGILALMLGLSLALMTQANVFLSWAISSPFNLAMTYPNGNIIIELGWTLMRDFTNMLFILGLAYIGLATALDIAGFDTKKAFINLLLIALLINFTPVICGAIVDISNIITNFFTEDIGWWERI